MIQLTIGNMLGSVTIPNITYQGPAGIVWVLAEVLSNGSLVMSPTGGQTGDHRHSISVPSCSIPTIVPVNLTIQLQFAPGSSQFLTPGLGLGRLIFFDGAQHQIIAAFGYADQYQFVAPVTPVVQRPPIVPLPPPSFIPIPPPPVYVPPPPPSSPPAVTAITGVVIH